MQKLFTKILLPVNFSRNTHWFVDKGVQLANKFGCDIVLLHAQQPPVLMPFLPVHLFSNSTAEVHLRVKMRELELRCQAKLKEGLAITSATLVGTWQPVLKDLIIAEHIDLALVPRCNKRLGKGVIRSINIDKLSLETNCPVMTVTRNFNANHLQKIVVPVVDILPVKKLTMATYLSYESSGCIFLMGKEDSASTGPGKGYLMRAYKLLNDIGRMNIQCALQGNEDTAGSTLAYARNVKASLIVVNPGKESRLRGLWNSPGGKYLNRESDIPVLTVSD
jgi:hypothetical protein